MAAELVDRVVAVVNDDLITLSELNEEGKEFFQMVTEKTPEDELSAVLSKARREMLSRLIDRKITIQKAEEIGISVSDAEIDGAVRSILDRNKTTRENFLRQLRAMGISESKYRSSLREQILHSKLVGYEVDSKIVITEEKANEFYSKEYLKELPDNAYYILQMGFTWGGSSGRTEEEARQQAERVREMVLAGQNFKELARQYSELPSAADGGDIGVIKENEMASYMRETIKSVRPGEVSSIVETGNAYQFFKPLAVKHGEIVTLAPFESVKEEIIELLRKREHEKLYGKWVQELREQAYIRELL